ncbi:hypothetical protein CI109_106920 [Kwoniella shandongensis]|uniref:Chromatin modification-related protein n=1 Tax=Kwoniella shandongensis TaxID=1734106 RepID=A0A5M6CB32_9TREE|nr:uncharacterized protein CI109_000825 [Kwoniella shandongensis]KAA5530645.1 hypothetical protein CI109_000825 [Kwoniella shandongensis]
MPPKQTVLQPPSPSPPPPSNDAQDLLVIHDIMDTLDQIPPEITRVHSDLNELGAVLYSTLLSLEQKLYTLINWIQDPNIKPEKRFELLQEIAEEAARYKLGGDDKIRVAGGACDGIMAHQRHISNLLAASTLLNPSPPSPYTQTLTLPYLQPTTTSRRAARAANSPFGGRGYAAAANNGGPSETRVGDTPTKKKKSRVQQLGARDDDETSSVGGDKEKKKPAKKRKPVNRALSPTESVASTSAFTGKAVEPRTARQLAAAASKARKAEQDDGSDEDSRDEPRRGGLAMQPSPSADSVMDRKDGGLGLDMGSREGSNIGGLGGRSANATPVLSQGVVGEPKNGRPGRARAGVKRSRADDDDDDESDGEEEESLGKPVPKRSTSGKKATQAYDVETVEQEGLGGGEEVDSKVYCTCRQVSYGEMIGCDDDDCEIEWYHLACLGLDKTPEGNWICPRCVERRKKQPKSKKTTKGKNRK